MLQAVNSELQRRARAGTPESESKAYQLWYYTNVPVGGELYRSYGGYNLNSIAIAENRESAVLSINRHVLDQTKAFRSGSKRRNAMDVVHSTADYALDRFEEKYRAEFEVKNKLHVAKLTDMIVTDLFDEENDTMHIKEFLVLDD